MTDPVALAYVGLASSALTMIGVIVNTIISNHHNLALAKLNTVVTETKTAIVTLEKNTNSIKDELVKVTGQAEFAKGLKAGMEGK